MDYFHFFHQKNQITHWKRQMVRSIFLQIINRFFKNQDYITQL